MILDQIVAYTRKRVEEEKKIKTLDMNACKRVNKEFPFEQALRKSGIQFICEVKKASPSKGVIAERFDYIQIAKEYELAGASCISVLTEPKFFQGKDQYLSDIRNEVAIPILRKDFIIDSYQIYQAKAIGADAVLLICSILSQQKLQEYHQLCDSLGLTALVEIHDEEEAELALKIGARIIGVNNRNLKDFSVDIENSLRLRAKIPEEVLFVAESGIRTPEDIKKLEMAHVNGVLIGETMMKCNNKKEMLDYLKS